MPSMLHRCPHIVIATLSLLQLHCCHWPLILCCHHCCLIITAPSPYHDHYHVIAIASLLAMDDASTHIAAVPALDTKNNIAHIKVILLLAFSIARWIHSSGSFPQCSTALQCESTPLWLLLAIAVTMAEWYCCNLKGKILPMPMTTPFVRQHYCNNAFNQCCHNSESYLEKNASVYYLGCIPRLCIFNSN